MKSIFWKVLTLVVAVLLLIAPALAQESKTAEATKGSDSSKSSDAANPVIAVFRLSGSLTETPTDDSFPFSSEHTTALKDLIARFKKAQEDKNVKAVVITVSNLSLGFAQIEELRQAIAELRSAGKDVYAHADSLSMPQYILLSAATQLSMVPTGDLWITGLSGESLHVRKLLDMIGAKPDFLTCGAYKSAAELFMRDSPSPQNEEMLNWLFDSLYESSVKQIARGRGVTPEKVRQWIDGGHYSAERAHSAGLTDAVQTRQDFEAGVKQRFDGNVKFDTKYGERSHKQIDFSSPLGILNFYAELLGSGKKSTTHKDSVAIVYVEGPIVVGTAPTSLLDPGAKVAASTPIRTALNKAAADDTIKAVVLRVNSPGGSAVASEIILDATKRVKAKKPLVVSMGDVAGSGGYYVACGSDTIFADESTITASIGVVVGKLATTDMWGKVGITWKEFTRGANAGLLSSSQTFTADQRKTVQAWMDEVYGEFKGHVTAIRGNRLKKPIDDLAGGRVFTGRQALDLGLVDKIGTLTDAVKFAAQEAKIDKYEIRVVPEPKNVLETLLEGASGNKGEDDVTSGIRTTALTGREASMYGAVLPHLKGLDPRRAEAVLRAFQQLEILEREGVVLMMPELAVR
jgi:protease IV